MLETIFAVALILVCSYAAKPWVESLPIYSIFALHVISAAIGILLGGLIYVISIVAGFKSEWFAVAFLLALIISNQFSFSHQHVSPQHNSENSIPSFLTLIFFLCFGGLILVTSIKMGFGEFPQIFVNMDTPMRLSHAFAILKSETYPPESLMNANTYHAYHYGGPASVAFFSSVTGIQPHKTMFWIVNPIFLLAAFYSIISLASNATASRFRIVLAFALFLPAVFLGKATWNLISSDTFLDDIIVNTIGDLGPNTYDSEKFARGVPGTATLAGLFLLFFSSLIIYTVERWSFATLVLATGIFVVFTKMDFAPAVFILLGVAAVRYGGYYSWKTGLLTILFLVITPFVFMHIFGYFSTPAETGMLSIRPFGEALSFFDWRWNQAKGFIVEQLISLALFIALLLLFLRSDKSPTYKDSVFLGFAAIVIVVGLRVLVAFVDIPKTGGQLASPMWIAVPLLGVALIQTSKLYFRYIAIMLLLPFCFVGLQGQWHKFNHFIVAVVLPELTNEYADNRLIGDAMRHIPVTQTDWAYQSYVFNHLDLRKAYSEINFARTATDWGKEHFRVHGRNEGRRIDLKRLRPLVVTNDFHYVNWPDSQPQIPALFGHNAYGVHLRHFPGPRGFNREGERRITAQLTYLSREFSDSNPDFVATTKRIAKKRNWTHFLLRKDLYDGFPPVDANSVPLRKLYENDRYAVFEF
ncbi:MAG: hypothetical protein CL400_04945 [Acidiferrobacteraceae bacterium]|nr:hypothetical protein [Acidiferrobacteraceae bacterium]